MSETADPGSRGGAPAQGDTSAVVTTDAVVAAPEVTRTGRKWSPKRIAGMALAAAVVIFLIV
jgi:hypothetical protein